MPRPIALVLAAAFLGAGSAGVRSSAATDNAWVIVVDDLHLQFSQTGRLRDLLQKVAAELIQEGDRYLFRASGPSSMSLTTSAVTDDRDLASSVIKMMAGNALKDSDILAAGSFDEVIYRANTALDAAEEAVFALTRDAAPRQAIVYVSNGYDVETFPAFAKRIRMLARRARENSITIFAIDARGLETQPIPNSTEAWSRYAAATRRSLAILTEETAGFVIERPNMPGPELARINAQMRN